MTYDKATLKRMFDGADVSPILPYDCLIGDANVALELQKGHGRISISGVQPKLSMVVSGNVLRLTDVNEQGRYILKPVPNAPHLLETEFLPENEHISMLIAEKVFKIETAACALCYFGNGQAAYLTKRFDVLPSGAKRAMEDLASVAGLTRHNGGEDYKYNNLSYEECAELIRNNTKASLVEVLKFFSLVVYNYLICNDDAHLKNFSLIDRGNGDYGLSPAYDLVNTSLHLFQPQIFALKKGLFKEGMPNLWIKPIDRQTFLEFGLRIGLPEKTVRRELDRFAAEYGEMNSIIAGSSLSDSLKESYLNSYIFRRKTLRQ